MIPTELKNIEMKLDREKLEEQKNKDQYVRNKLDRMMPCVTFRVPQCKLHTIFNFVTDIDLGTSNKRAKGENCKEE